MAVVSVEEEGRKRELLGKWRLGEEVSPRHVSIISMSVAMALHFFGYEFARSSALTLFTSEPPTGFSKQSKAFPLAMACISPVSVGMLFGYGHELRKLGPRKTLRRTSLLCALFLSSVAVSVRNAQAPLLQWICCINFIFQNCYAHLLYTQYFSFIGSVSSSSEGKRWFSLIAGLTSISSTFAAALLSRTLPFTGVSGLLYVASGALVLSTVAGDVAYFLAQTYGFHPFHDIQNQKSQKQQLNLMWRASLIFNRVPVLKALFWEVLAFQTLSAVLNVRFVRTLQLSLPHDVHRAAFMGNFYALINGTCGILQFLILPWLFRNIHPKHVWTTMPLLLLSFILCNAITPLPSLIFIALPFFALKVMDYSSRATANELVYVPLDYESRYVGKEIVGVFGNGFGKSGVSLLLAALHGNDFRLNALALLSAIAWLLSSLKLSRLLPPDQNEKRDD